MRAQLVAAALRLLLRSTGRAGAAQTFDLESLLRPDLRIVEVGSHDFHFSSTLRARGHERLLALGLVPDESALERVKAQHPGVADVLVRCEEPRQVRGNSAEVLVLSEPAALRCLRRHRHAQHVLWAPPSGGARATLGFVREALRGRPRGLRLVGLALFRDDAGALSPYAPGHGDLTFALRRSGLLVAFRSNGGRTLMMSNVDNLTATLDPAVIGAHEEAGAALTAEMAPKEPGDKGGAPARVDGKAQIVESFRFPEDFDQERIPVFNTNTFVLDAKSIDAEFPLTWFAVNKTIDGKPAVQFERLVGELTAFLDPAFLRVERHGPDARFQPIKSPEDMDKRRPDIVKALEARGSL